MRSLFVAAFFLVACGSRTPLDLGDDLPIRGSGDGGAPTPAEPPPGAQIVPDGHTCYGEVTHVHGLVCGATSKSGATCDGTLYCNGEVAVQMQCDRGLCHCVATNGNDCYCHPTEGLTDVCGAANCCWR